MNDVTTVSGVSFTQSINLFFKNYFNFKGRSSRSAYWWWVLASILISIACSTADAIILSATYSVDTVGPIELLYSLIILIPSISLGFRRMHDVGRSGWWFLIIFTVIGLIPYIYWLCKKSDPEANKYGDAVEAGL